MANLFAVPLLQLFRLEVFYCLAAEFLEVIDQLAECIHYVTFEVSKVYEDTLFLGLNAKCTHKVIIE